MSQAVYARTIHVPLDELTPFLGNAKRGDVATILTSLRRNAQYRSLVVREITNGPLVVLAGNHTMQAFAAHGPGDCGQTVTHAGTERPCGICRNDASWEPGARCEIVTCDDDTARRINLVDNRASDLGGYDFEALSAALGAVDDLDGTGYSARQADDIAALLTAPPDDIEELVGNHGEPDENVFRPQIKLSVDADVFDRWRTALDAHNGNDDETKLRGLLDEIDTHRAESPAT